MSPSDADPVRAKVTANGQVSLPAALRHRWGVREVVVIDVGDYAIVRPVPEDVWGELEGRYAGPGPSGEQARADERRDDAEREARRSTPR